MSVVIYIALGVVFGAFLISILDRIKRWRAVRLTTKQDTLQPAARPPATRPSPEPDNEPAARPQADAGRSKSAWRCDVIADETGKWLANGMVFKTREEALDYGLGLSVRWRAIREVKAVQCDEEVNSSWQTGVLHSIVEDGQLRV